jgi:hypothetical protein
MPTASDLVTDLPADFETFGQAVATSMADLLGGTTGQVLAKNSNTDMDFVWTSPNPGDITAVTAGTGISGGGTSGAVTLSIDTAVTADLTTAQTLTNKTLTSPALTTPTISTLTTNGDLLYGTGSGAIARRAVGTTGQVLTVSGGLPTWATPAAPSGKTWTLINTGGTSLSGSSSVTVSGISDKEDLLILVYYAPITNASSEMQVRFNGDTGAKYTSYYNTITASSSYSVDSYNSEVNQNANYITIGKTSNNNTSEICAGMTVSGCKSTGIKNFWFNGGGSPKTGSGHVQRIGQGIYSATAAITSVNVSAGSNFTGGTLYVYGA